MHGTHFAPAFEGAGEDIVFRLENTIVNLSGVYGQCELTLT